MASRQRRLLQQCVCTFSTINSINKHQQTHTVVVVAAAAAAVVAVAAAAAAAAAVVVVVVVAAAVLVVVVMVVVVVVPAAAAAANRGKYGGGGGGGGDSIGRAVGRALLSCRPYHYRRLLNCPRTTLVVRRLKRDEEELVVSPAESAPATGSLTVPCAPAAVVCTSVCWCCSCCWCWCC